jgi:isopenicillin N synthase-like dioxygenase
LRLSSHSNNDLVCANKMPATLPVIDLEPWFAGDPQQRLELCQRVRQLCHEIGFFYVINHGIPTGISDSYLQTLKAFFALSQATKQAIDKQGSAQFRGWEQLGSELTNNQIDYGQRGRHFICTDKIIVTMRR